MSVSSLQNEINRFAADPDIGFTPLVCDGVMGPATLQAAFYALTIVNLRNDLQDTMVGDFTAQDSAGSFLQLINTPQDLTNQMGLVEPLLKTSADVLGYGYTNCVAGPGTTQQSNPAPLTTKAKSISNTAAVKTATANVPLVGNLYQSWANLPSVVHVLGYSAIGIGGLILGRHIYRKVKHVKR